MLLVPKGHIGRDCCERAQSMCKLPEWLFLLLWMLVCTPEITQCFLKTGLAHGLPSRLSLHTTAPFEIHSLMKCIFSKPMALNPVSFPSCQSFKKLSVIQKDRFLFKVDPSKGTYIFNKNTWWFEYIYYDILWHWTIIWRKIQTFIGVRLFLGVFRGTIIASHEAMTL